MNGTTELLPGPASSRATRSGEADHGAVRLTVCALLAVSILASGCSPVGSVPPETTPVPIDVPAAERPNEGARPVVEQRRPEPRVTVRRPVAPVQTRIDPVLEDEEPFYDPILSSPVREMPEMKKQIDFWISFWTGRSRENFQRYLDRMGVWQHVVDREIEAQGLPWSLRYVPMIESGYNPVAVSRANAVGMWQFMSGTARWKGMRVDGLVDNRRDPIAATPVALEYLTEINEQVDSWFLALAAYNVGPGRVRTVIRRHAPPGVLGDSLFVAVSKHLPNETRHHVPRFFAAAEIAMNPEMYGFIPPNPADSLVFIEESVEKATSLDVVAEAAGAELDDVVALNPMLVQRVTPLNSPWRVRLPLGTGHRFAERLAEIPSEDRVTFIQHRVARGETLGQISERYGVRLSALQAANPGVNPRRMQIGQRLIVPRGSSGDASRVATRSSESAPAQRTAGTATAVAAQRDPGGVTGGALTHVVQRGDSPWSIARRYGVSVAEVLEWNDLKDGATLFPGNRLQIREAKVVLYRVERGDTLSGIAQKHGVSTQRLAEWNGLSLRAVIRPGQEMKIPFGS